MPPILLLAIFTIEPVVEFTVIPANAALLFEPINVIDALFVPTAVGDRSPMILPDAVVPSSRTPTKTFPPFTLMPADL